jgi:hypothetical protein
MAVALVLIGLGIVLMWSGFKTLMAQPCWVVARRLEELRRLYLDHEYMLADDELQRESLRQYEAAVGEALGLRS